MSKRITDVVRVPSKGGKQNGPAPTSSTVTKVTGGKKGSVHDRGTWMSVIR